MFPQIFLHGSLSKVETLPSRRVECIRNIGADDGVEQLNTPNE